MSAACETAATVQCAPAQMLFKVPGAPPGWGISPDGDRFLFAVTPGAPEPEPFTVILNWFAQPHG